MDPSARLPPICRKPPYRTVTEGAPASERVPASEAGRASEGVRVYHVPRRFGLLAVMSFLTAFSLLFALLRFMGYPPAVYMSLGIFGVVIAGLQMSFGKVPRAASVSAGAILLPLNVLIVALLDSGWQTVFFLLSAFPFMAAAGGFFGYLAGTLVAGLFLILDYWERRLFPGMTRKGNGRKGDLAGD